MKPSMGQGQRSPSRSKVKVNTKSPRGSSICQEGNRHPRRQDKKSTQSKEGNVKPKKAYVDFLSCLLGCLLTSWLPSLPYVDFLSCLLALLEFNVYTQEGRTRCLHMPYAQVQEGACRLLVLPSWVSANILVAFFALCRLLVLSSWTSWVAM